MRWLVPTRRQGIDLALLVALCVVALLGLDATYTGLSYAVVGSLAVVLGATVAHVAAARGLPPVVSLLGLLAVLVLLGPPLTLRGVGQGLPGPGGVTRLAEELTGGWKDLLTTLPPVDGAGPLLVLPWVLGLVAGWVAVLLARWDVRPRWAAVVLPLSAPTALLAAVVLLGVSHPASLWLQGVVFAGLALTWLVVRADSTVTVMGRARRVRRVAGAAAMLGVSALVALPLAGLAGGDDDGRLHLRAHVEPPFDIGQYPSPLASFRRYVQMPKPDAVNLYDETLLELEGAPEGTRLRIATLDHYDGVVWGASNHSVGAAGTDGFQRVSTTIDNPARGREVEVAVTVGDGYRGVWVPTIGALQGLEFRTGGEELATAFRYNLATSTGVVPSGLQPGDRYRFTTVVRDTRVTPDAQPATGSTAGGDAGGFLATQAVQWSAGESRLMRRVLEAAEYLRREGKYSDGVLEAEKIYHPGHHTRRLAEEFANAPIMVGNDEQYAAVMALVANQIGVPARVVLGAVVPADGRIEGKDVQAWVELQVADGSWRTLPTEAFMDFDRPAEQPPRTEQEMTGTNVPPPAPIPPPSTVGEQTDAELKARDTDRDDDRDSSLPAWLRAVLVYVGGPLLVLALLVGLVVGLKAWRRHRRRTATRVSARIVGGWRELVDHARDLGHPVSVAGTRREQSGSIAWTAAPVLARTADQHVFGPASPDAGVAAGFWEEVDRARREMSTAVGRRRRALAAVSLRTFRRSGGSARGIGAGQRRFGQR